MVGETVKHESASFPARIRGDGKCVARQSTKQSRVVRQTLDCCLLPRRPIDEDIRFNKVAKGQLYCHGSGFPAAQTGDDALAGPKVRLGPDDGTEVGCFVPKFRWH